MAILSYQSHAGALVIARFRFTDHSWSDPLLVVPGPMAASPQGTSLDLLETCAPVPDDPSSHFSQFCPLEFSLSAQTHPFWESSDPLVTPAKRQAAFMAEVPVCISPDAHEACTFIPWRDATGDVSASILADDPLSTNQLWIPDIAADDDNSLPHCSQDVARSQGCGNNSSPPQLLSFLSWAKDMSLLPPGQEHHVFTCTEPMFATPDKWTAPCTLDNHGHPRVWFFFLQFLLLPTGHRLPIGLLLDPKATNLELLRELILECTPTNDQHRANWIDNLVLEAWLLAAEADATNFCIDLEESAFIFEQMDDVCGHSTMLQTIQQSISWMLTQHLFANAVLASATKSMGGCFTKCWMSASCGLEIQTDVSTISMLKEVSFVGACYLLLDVDIHAVLVHIDDVANLRFLA